mgnify:CR=1 FL=1
MNPFLTENDDDSIKDIFRKKQVYEVINRSNHVNLIDFHFAEKALYGRVDRYYQPIVPNERVLSLKDLNSQAPSGLKAFNFVVDAFNELQNKFKLKLVRSEISANEKYLSDLIPTAAYSNPRELYDKYTRSYSIAVRGVVTKQKLRFTNFQEFLNVLMPYIKNSLKTKSFTYPAYVKSKECPINVSGLVIEIADIDPNNDKHKYDNFYNSQNWDFFVNACNTYGFMVDANMPNRLVADIASPNMVNKMARYNQSVNSTDTFLATCYDQAALGYFESFRRFFYLLYSENRKNRILTTTHNHHDGTRTVVNKVINYSYEDFTNQFDNLYFLNLYCIIRFLEEESKFTDYQKHALITNTVELANKDFAYALSSFEKLLNKTFDYSGSLSYILNRKKELGL